jgi:riboflavin synthase
MFTGIIESRGTVQNIHQEGSNVHFNLASDISSALKIDQSVSHNGVCLTVVGIQDNVHTVTAVEETLKRSNLGQWQVGSLVNLERAMLSNGRLDGHIVQGHVDGTARCIKVEDRDGSWNFHFQYTPAEEHLLVDKGSICINGVSLTVVSPVEDRFSVAIIPYTFEHTTFQTLLEGDLVNLEFDVIGKYIAQYAKLYFKPTLVP